MAVCIIEKNMAIAMSQSSSPNCRDESRPATRATTTIRAIDGKKKLMAMAKFWRPVVGPAGMSRTDPMPVELAILFRLGFVNF